jgi:hypothetical protein
MKIEIVLTSKAGELDRQTIDIDDDDPDEISHEIFEAMEAWVLSPGDTITITEKE